jgi:hypothetical protein
MATFTNTTPVQMPGTASPTPQVASYQTGIRIRPGPGGKLTFTPTCQAFAADGTIVAPPRGWVFPTSVQSAFSAACLAALDASTPATTTPPQALVPALRSIGGYNGP